MIKKIPYRKPKRSTGYLEPLHKINELVDKVNELEQNLLQTCLALKSFVDMHNEESIAKLKGKGISHGEEENNKAERP